MQIINIYQTFVTPTINPKPFSFTDDDFDKLAQGESEMLLSLSELLICSYQELEYNFRSCWKKSKRETQRIFNRLLQQGLIFQDKDGSIFLPMEVQDFLDELASKTETWLKGQ